MPKFGFSLLVVTPICDLNGSQKSLDGFSTRDYAGGSVGMRVSKGVQRVGDVGRERRSGKVMFRQNVKRQRFSLLGSKFKVFLALLRLGQRRHID